MMTLEDTIAMLQKFANRPGMHKDMWFDTTVLGKVRYFIKDGVVVSEIPADLRRWLSGYGFWIITADAKRNAYTLQLMYEPVTKHAL